MDKGLHGRTRELNGNRKRKQKVFRVSHTDRLQMIHVARLLYCRKKLARNILHESIPGNVLKSL
jgi:hypothetical protein